MSCYHSRNSIQVCRLLEYHLIYCTIIEHVDIHIYIFCDLVKHCILQFISIFSLFLCSLLWVIVSLLLTNALNFSLVSYCLIYHFFIIGMLTFLNVGSKLRTFQLFWSVYGNYSYRNILPQKVRMQDSRYSKNTTYGKKYLRINNSLIQRVW